MLSVIGNLRFLRTSGGVALGTLWELSFRRFKQATLIRRSDYDYITFNPGVGLVDSFCEWKILRSRGQLLLMRTRCVRPQGTL